MTPKDLLAIVDPALALLEPTIKRSDEARVLLMTIAGQEDDWDDRRQIGCFTPGQFQTVGARGLWQFERKGAVAQVMGATPTQLKAVCTYLIIPFNEADLYEAIAWNDTLAACMARLLLWTDPAPLPAIGDVQAAWDYYARNWRPGAPHREDLGRSLRTAKGHYM